MTMAADKKDDLTKDLFDDENANRSLDDPLSGGGAGIAATASRISLKSVCSEESNLGSASLEDVKCKSQDTDDSLPSESEQPMTSSELLVTIGDFDGVNHCSKFREMVIECCQKKVRDRLQHLSQEQQQENVTDDMQHLPQEQQQEQLTRGLFNGIEELELEVAEREQHQEASFLSQAQAVEAALADESVIREQMKRKVRKQWKKVAKTLITMAADKKDDLTKDLFDDENANRSHDDPLSEGGAGIAAAASRISLKSVSSEESNLGSASLEDVKCKSQDTDDSLPSEREQPMTSSELLVTIDDFDGVDHCSKFREMVIERCQKKVRDRLQHLSQEQQQETDETDDMQHLSQEQQQENVTNDMQHLPQEQQQEQLATGLFNGIEELELEVAELEQDEEASFLSQAHAAEASFVDASVLRERMKRKARKQWKKVAKTLMTIAAAKKEDLTVVLFYDETANRFHNEPLSGGSAGIAAAASRISLNAACSEETILGRVSLDDVKYKLQVPDDSLPDESELPTTSSELLVTTSGEFVEVDNYKKFKEMVIERFKQKVRDRVQHLPEEQQQEQLATGLFNGIEELELKVVEREQHKEASFLSQAQVARAALVDESVLRELVKRKVRKQWKKVAKRILLSRIGKYYK